MIKLDQQYWQERYTKNSIGWDLGKVSTPLKNYINQLTDKDISILIQVLATHMKQNISLTAVLKTLLF